MMRGLCCSNVDAGRRFGIPVRGTHSHAFVSSFMVTPKHLARHFIYLILKQMALMPLQINLIHVETHLAGHLSPSWLLFSHVKLTVI